MAQAGTLVLVLGDLHIPHRANAIPTQFKKLLVPGKIKHIFCTGNLCGKDTYEYLRSLSSEVHVTKGDFDDSGTSSQYPSSKVITIGNFKIGLIHGHQVVPWGDPESLAAVQRDLDVDILISGHTHKLQSMKKDGAYFLNPGSITGAYSSTDPNVTPSFMLLNVQENKVVVYRYTLPDGNYKVGEEVFEK